MSALPAESRDWLGRPGLAPLWDRTRERLERNSLRAAGGLRLTGLDLRERTDLSQLLGRPVTGPAVTVRLARTWTSGCVRPRSGSGSPRPWTRGPPLTDHRATRADAEARRERVWSGLAAAVDASPLAGETWVREWTDALCRAGTPGGMDPETAMRTLRQAVHVLTVLFAEGRAGTLSRGELATDAAGSAHGLDDGRWLARLVQRGIALAHGTGLPEEAAGRRALWRLASVTPDEISSTVLAYGLRPGGEGWRERALRERAEHRAEAHLTLRDLPALRLSRPNGTLVRICENPRVVEAAAEAGCARPLVCTSGSASTVARTLLDALAATGCRFAYHGDFDWPGIALANRIVRRYTARPWRFEAADTSGSPRTAAPAASPGSRSPAVRSPRTGTRTCPSP